ncbi:hypothetical protein IW150_005296 [Coemansia sp. RSA 2607]|nr:hypothetical protein IW150_005296 [Coemansia sp. RSA 2607]
MQTAKDFGDELGAGLIQTEDAWQFLKKHAKRTYEDVEYDTLIMDTEGMQGIYLRNAQDSDVIRHLQIKVSPVFPTDPKVKLENDPDGSHGEQQSQTMFDFEQRVILTTNVPWVRVPEALYVGSAGNSFGAIVDATKLEPGHLHVASIDGYDSNNVDRGPIFSVPVTVTKPYQVDASACIRFNELRFNPTDVVRRFISVPAGATRATIMINSRNNAANASAPAVFYLHCLQLSPQTRFNTYELKKRIQVGHKSYVAGGGLAEQRNRSTMDVIGNATLEVCVAQFWSQLGSHEVDVFVSFNGIVPSSAALSGGQSSAVVINGNSGIMRADFAALVCPEYKISPSVSLDTLRTSLRPTEASISPVGSERDVHPATGVAIYKLVMDYKLTIKANDTQIQLHMPAFDTMIYENWADDFALAIFDVNKRRISAQISYTKPVTISKKGDYLVRVQLRHRSPQDLESLKNMPMMVDTKLSSPVSLQIKNSLAGAFTSTVRSPQSTNTIPLGDHMPMFFKTEAGSLPAEAAPGDIVRGTLSLSSTTASLQLEYVVPTKIPTKSGNDSAGSGNGASESKDEKESQSEKDLKAIEEALRKVRLEWIKKTKDDSVRDKLVADLIAGSADDSEKAAVLAAQLESIDIASKNTVPWSEQAKFSKTSAKRAVELADRLVGLSYSTALTSRLYESQQAKTASAEDKELKQKADKAKDQVVAALRAKCRALAFLATQNTISCASSEASVEFIDVTDASDDSDLDSDVAVHVKDYEKAVSQLVQWVPASSQSEDAAYLLATTPLHIAKHNYAQALQPVLKWLSKAPLLASNAQERKSMTELRDQLLSKLHWTIWTEYFRALAVAESPASYEAL